MLLQKQLGQPFFDRPTTMITVRVLDTPSKNQLLVSWRQSGLCNYTEQLWALRKAPRSAICPVSGKAIRRGDHVYRPVGKPLNHAECILAEAIKLP